MLPKANHRQMIQFVQDEFVDVQSQYEDLLYDYTILKEKVENMTEEDIDKLGHKVEKILKKISR